MREKSQGRGGILAQGALPQELWVQILVPPLSSYIVSVFTC